MDMEAYDPMGPYPFFHSYYIGYKWEPDLLHALREKDTVILAGSGQSHKDYRFADHHMQGKRLIDSPPKTWCEIVFCRWCQCQNESLSQTNLHKKRS